MNATLKALARPKTAAGTLIATLVLWNPAIAGAATVVLGGTEHFARSWAVAAAISEVVALQCFATIYLIRWIASVYHRRRDRPSPRWTMGFHFFLAAALLPLALPLALAAGGLTAAAVGAEWESPGWATYRAAIGLGLVLVAFFFFQRSRAEARDAAHAAERRMGELENRRLQAQLSALTAEMNPHLLFNALNTVASLVHRDPDRAEEVVVQLAHLYRGVLRSAGLATHPLEDELRLCDAYLQVEHARFGDRLVREIDIDPAIDTHAIRVPVLLLQPLMENAVKHGLSPRTQGGRVRLELRVRGECLDMTVDDDGVGIGASLQQGTGKGIANCRERLALTYGARASLEVGSLGGGGTRVVVSIPRESRGWQ